MKTKEIKGHLYWKGSWVAGEGPPLTSHNPATGECIWEGAEASSAQIQQALAAAKEALPKWSHTPIGERILFLNRYREKLQKDGEGVARLISLETGKPLWESRAEVEGMIAKIPLSIEALNQRCPEIHRQQKGAEYTLTYRPLGVCAILAPFNMPGHLSHGHIVPALLAGNTLLLKPSEETPAVGALLSQLWEEVDLPPGVLNLLQGGANVGEELALDPAIDGLFFTGGASVGRRLSRAYGAHPEKMLVLEMGGNNPILVAEVANQKGAIAQILLSAFTTSGQRCTSARRLILIDNQESKELLDALIESAQKLRVGPCDLLPEPFMGPLISPAAAQEALDRQEALLALGAYSLLPMRMAEIGPAFLSPGILDVTDIKELPDQEIFAPLLQVKRVQNIDAAIEEANHTCYGLSGALLSDRKEYWHRFSREVKGGVLNWNAPTIGASSAFPFGGVGWSGNHRPTAWYAADYCVTPLVSQKRPTLIPPVTPPPGWEEIR